MSAGRRIDTVAPDQRGRLSPGRSEPEQRHRVSASIRRSQAEPRRDGLQFGREYRMPMGPRRAATASGAGTLPIGPMAETVGAELIIAAPAARAHSTVIGIDLGA